MIPGVEVRWESGPNVNQCDEPGCEGLQADASPTAVWAHVQETGHAARIVRQSVTHYTPRRAA